MRHRHPFVASTRHLNCHVCLKPYHDVCHVMPGYALPPENSPAGNAYCILGSWEAAARRAGWDKQSIAYVIAHATESDYVNLRRVIGHYSA